MVLTGDETTTGETRTEALYDSYNQFAASARSLSRDLGYYLNLAPGDFSTKLMSAHAKAIEFSTTHRKSVFQLKTEMMREATQVGELPILNLGEEFDPRNLRNAAKDWSLNLMQMGYEGLKRNSTLHYADGASVTFPNGFMEGLVRNVSHLYWFTYYQTYGLDSDSPQLAITDEQMISDFLDIGGETFATFLATEVNTVRNNGQPAHINRAEVMKSCDHDGVLGQLMRTGGDVSGAIIEKFIDGKSMSFKDDSPMGYIPGIGFTLDTTRLKAMHKDIVYEADPLRIRTKGKIPCPAYHGVDTSVPMSEQEMILLWMVRGLVNQIPDSYLETSFAKSA